MPIVNENNIRRKQGIIQVLIQQAGNASAEKLVDFEKILFSEGNKRERMEIRPNHMICVIYYEDVQIGHV